MSEKPYYLAYEERYRKVYEAGLERWGHAPDNEALVSALTEWVDENQLRGKRIIEFACGEGASGEILSELGCVYHGVDIAPSAVEKASIALEHYPNASVSLLDMVNDRVTGVYDAAIDIMGFHMLVLDSDRAKYLKNAFNCLKNGAPMLFFKQSYRHDAPASNEIIETIEQWTAITGEDYITPNIRTAPHTGTDIEVNIPLVPARAKNIDGYINDFTNAGFIFDSYTEEELNDQNPYSVTMYVHKP